MATVLLPIQNGNLAPDICFPDEQSRLNAYSGLQQAVLNGQAFYNFGLSKPDPVNNSYPWLNQNDMRWYFYSGDWISPVNYSLDERRWWKGLLIDLVRYDGGDVDAASDRSGPMWKEDTDFQGRCPMGPGIIPTSNPTKTLAKAEQFGEGAHVLTMPELPLNWPVSAVLSTWRTNLESDKGQWIAPPASTGTVIANPSTDTGNFNFLNTGGGQSHNNVPPVVGLYCVQWTGRLFRRVT